MLCVCCCGWQPTAVEGAQNELMGAYVKEQTRDDLEMDPEMCAPDATLLRAEPGASTRPF